MPSDEYRAKRTLAFAVARRVHPETPDFNAVAYDYINKSVSPLLNPRDRKEANTSFKKHIARPTNLKVYGLS